MKRRWIFALLVVAFIWIVVSRYSQIDQLRRTLQNGRWEWVALATLAECLFFVVYSASYHAAFNIVGVKSRTRDLLPILLSSWFMNLVAPSAGAAGMALFVEDLRHHGQPPARSAAGVLLQLTSDFAAITIILVFGLVYLFFQHDLELYEIVASAILFTITAGLTGILLLGLYHPIFLHKVLHRIQRTLNWVFGILHASAELAENWAERNAAEFSDAAGLAASNPEGLARAVAVAFSARAVEITALAMLFNAFNHPIQFGPLVAGYAMGILFLIVSITPMGVGVVEGIMSLVYTSLGIPSAVATTVVLAFRGLAFWIPLLLGFILLRRAKTFKAEKRPKVKQPDATGEKVQTRK